MGLNMFELYPLHTFFKTLGFGGAFAGVGPEALF